MSAGVYTEAIDLPIVLRPHKVESAIVAERTPLGVDQHVFLFRIFHAIEQFTVCHLLDVARITAGAFVWGRENIPIIILNSTHRLECFNSNLTCWTFVGTRDTNKNEK